MYLQRREEAKGILKDIQNRRARSEGAYPHPVRMDDSLGSICPDPLNISTRTPSVCLSPVNLKFDIGDDWPGTILQCVHRVTDNKLFDIGMNWLAIVLV